MRSASSWGRGETCKSKKSEVEGERSSEESNNDEGNNVTVNEALVNYSLTLNVKRKVNMRTSRSGEGLIEIKNMTPRQNGECAYRLFRETS